MIFLLACTEPIDLPADKGTAGVPVGVQTLEWDGLTLEVWYPTSDDHTDVEEADILQFVPDEIEDIVGGVNLPPLDSGERDAPVRRAGPYPVVLFSHGLGGYRLQSLDLTVHWASRGYVVVAADSSKVGREDFVSFAPISCVDTLITDPEISAEASRELTEQGVEVICAGGTP